MGFKCEQFSQSEKLNPCQVYQIHARASALLQHSRRYVRLKQSCYRHGIWVDCRGNMGFKCEQFSQCEKLNPCQVYQIHARASALLQHSRRYVRLKQSCYRHGQVCFSGVYCVYECPT